MARLVMATVLAMIYPASIAAASPYQVRLGDEGNEVVFESRAPMESFEGKTDQVSGRFDVDLSRLPDSVQVHIEVELASLDTGIGLRNKHMRENHLETDSFPKAVFTAGRVLSSSAATLTAGQDAKINLAGQMSLHGVTRDVEYDVDLHLDSTGAITVTSEFTIKLSDHGIKRPKFLFLKLADEQSVRISLVAHPVPPETGE